MFSINILKFVRKKKKNIVHTYYCSYKYLTVYFTQTVKLTGD